MADVLFSRLGVSGAHVLSNLLAIAGIIFRHKTYAELQNENQWLQI